MSIRRRASSECHLLLIVELLVRWIDHLELLWQVDPELKSVGVLGSFDVERNLRVDDTLSGTHPLNTSSLDDSLVSTAIFVLRGAFDHLCKIRNRRETLLIRT